MKNNFDLKKFLIENKLTANSRQIVNENQLPDATKDLKASAAFREVGIDMSKPVLVLTQDGGHGEQETRGTVSAQEALKMFQQLRANGMENDKQDYYEFENEINFSAEGYEYKIAYFEEESTTTALMQKASGKLKEESSENTNLPELRKQVESKLSGKHDEHLVDSVLHDCFESAEVLMDEQPGTTAADALFSVAENWEENYYDEGRDEEEAIAKDIVSVVKPLSGDSTSGIFSEIDSVTEDDDFISKIRSAVQGPEVDAIFAAAQKEIDNGDAENMADALANAADQYYEYYDSKGNEDGTEVAKYIMRSLPKSKSNVQDFSKLKDIDYSKQPPRNEETKDDLIKRAQNTPVPKDAKDRLAKRKAALNNEKAGTLQVSKGPNAEQEQRVIDIARDAIALMDEQPGTSAKAALNSVLGI